MLFAFYIMFIRIVICFICFFSKTLPGTIGPVRPGTMYLRVLKYPFGLGTIVPGYVTFTFS